MNQPVAGSHFHEYSITKEFRYFQLPTSNTPLGWETGFIPEEEGTTIINSSGIKECTVKESAEMIIFSNNSVRAFGSNIVLYDISGNKVKEGSNSITTEDLSPGMYIAKTSSNFKILKIIISNNEVYCRNLTISASPETRTQRLEMLFSGLWVLVSGMNVIVSKVLR